MGAHQQCLMSQKIAAAGGGGVTVGNYDANTGTGTSATATLSVNSGSFLVLIFRTGTNETDTVTGVTDNLNAGSWTQLSGPDDSPAATQRTYVFYKENTAAGSITVTAAISGSVTWYVSAGEFRGTPTSGVVDGTPPAASFQTTGTSFTTASVTYTVSGATISCQGTSGTVTQTAASGETVVTSESARAHIMFKAHNGSGSTTHSCSWTTNTSVNSVAFAIKAA